MRRLMASDLLPKRAVQPVKALAHIHFSELAGLDEGSAVQAKWIEACRVACEAMIVPVVSAAIDPGANEMLITACADYHRIRAQATGQDSAGQHDATDPQDSAAVQQPTTAGQRDGTASKQDGPDPRRSLSVTPLPHLGTATVLVAVASANDKLRVIRCVTSRSRIVLQASNMPNGTPGGAVAMGASTAVRARGVRARNGKEGFVLDVNVTYGEMQAAARQRQGPVIRRRAAIAVAAAVIVALSCVLSGTAMASTAPAAVRPMPATAGASAWYVPSAPVIAAVPGCGKGANVNKVVATYNARKYEAGGYRTDTLYCGNSDYGYRHLEGHIGEYFGGWASFSFAVAQTLKAPATFVVQENDNYQERAPIYQCFYSAGYYIIWTFIVISRISSGAIVTAYGRPGRTVNESCP